MKEQEKIVIRDILQSIPSEFRVIENQINRSVIEEYYRILEKLLVENKSNTASNIAAKPDETIKEKLVRLAQKGDVKGYREIEAVIRNHEKQKVVRFAYVALKFARLHLENQLSDAPVGFISSGLGGKGNKLRYYFAMTSDKQIERETELEIVEQLQIICKKCDSEFEEIENAGHCVLIKILISMEFAIGHVIEELISKFPSIDEGYLCTNVEKPTPEFIQRWINGEFDQED